MAKQIDKTVLDFGSSRISILIGGRGVNNTFVISGSAETEYDGFCDGEFLEPGQLKSKLEQVVLAAEESVKGQISEIYVGVPGEFTTSVCRETVLSFRSRRKITDLDVDELYASGDIFQGNRDYVVVNRTPVYFVLDENNRTLSPVGQSATKLSGFLCYTLAERKFIILITRLLTEIGIRSVKFVSSVLAESLFLFDRESRENYAVLLDVGYITSNLAVVRGDGLLYLKTVPMGGGHITADLTECLHLPFPQAESLKRKVELTLKVSPEDTYQVQDGEQILSFPSEDVHEVVSSRLEDMGLYFKKCLDECPYPFPEYVPVSLTGGGVCYMRGAREYLSQVMGKTVDIVAPNVPQINKPHLSSLYGLLDFALERAEPRKKGGFNFITKLFFGE